MRLVLFKYNKKLAGYKTLKVENVRKYTFKHKITK